MISTKDSEDCAEGQHYDPRNQLDSGHMGSRFYLKKKLSRLRTEVEHALPSQPLLLSDSDAADFGSKPDSSEGKSLSGCLQSYSESLFVTFVLKHVPVELPLKDIMEKLQKLGPFRIQFERFYLMPADPQNSLPEAKLYRIIGFRFLDDSRELEFQNAKRLRIKGFQLRTDRLLVDESYTQFFGRTFKNDILLQQVIGLGIEKDADIDRAPIHSQFKPSSKYYHYRHLCHNETNITIRLRNHS